MKYSNLLQAEEKRALEAAADSVRQDLELSETHAETLTQELVDARVLASQTEAEMEERRSRSASKLEQAERLLIEEKGRAEELAQELASLRVTASEAAALSERYQELSDAFSKLGAESQGCNSKNLR